MAIVRNVYTTRTIRDAVATYFKVQSYRKAASICNVPKSCIHRWVTVIGKRGNKRAKRRKCRRKHSNCGEVIVDAVKNCMRENPFFTAHAIKTLLEEKDIITSVSTVKRAIKRAGFTYKKAMTRVVPDHERITAHRRLYSVTTELIDLTNAVSVDETSFDTGMFKAYGYSRKGERLTCQKQVKTRQRCSLILAVSASGDFVAKTVQGSVNTALFVDFVRSLPQCDDRRPLLLDNVSFHHSKAVLQAIEERGYTAVFSPPYSPECNPVEHVFSCLKTAYRDSATNAIVETTSGLPTTNLTMQVSGFINEYLTTKKATSMDAWMNTFQHCRRVVRTWSDNVI